MEQAVVDKEGEPSERWRVPVWKVEGEWLTANCVVILHFSMENINSMFRIRRVRSLEVIQVC